MKPRMTDVVLPPTFEQTANAGCAAGCTTRAVTFRSNDGDVFTDVQLVDLADRINAHLSTLAPVAGIPLDDWNEIFGDFQSAAQLLVGIANTRPAAKGGAA